MRRDFKRAQLKSKEEILKIGQGDVINLKGYFKQNRTQLLSDFGLEKHENGAIKSEVKKI